MLFPIISSSVWWDLVKPPELLNIRPNSVNRSTELCEFRIQPYKVDCAGLIMGLCDHLKIKTHFLCPELTS